jgi:hypothetical protein
MVSSSALDVRERTDEVQRGRVWPLAPNLIRPYGSVRDVRAIFISEDAIKVLFGRRLEVLVCEVRNGAVAEITPSKSSLQEDGEGKDELHVSGQQKKRSSLGPRNCKAVSTNDGLNPH